MSNQQQPQQQQNQLSPKQQQNANTLINQNELRNIFNLLDPKGTGEIDIKYINQILSQLDHLNQQNIVGKGKPGSNANLQQTVQMQQIKDGNQNQKVNNKNNAQSNSHQINNNNNGNSNSNLNGNNNNNLNTNANNSGNNIIGNTNQSNVNQNLLVPPKQQTQNKKKNSSQSSFENNVHNGGQQDKSGAEKIGEEEPNSQSEKDKGEYIQVTELIHFPQNKNSINFNEFCEMYNECINSKDILDQLLIGCYNSFDYNSEGFINSQKIQKIFEIFKDSTNIDEIQNVLKFCGVSEDKMTYNEFKDFFKKNI